MAIDPSAEVRGRWAAGIAFLYWGLIPVYWKAFSGVGAGEVIAHRIIWSLVFAGGLVFLRGSATAVARVLHNRRETMFLALASVLLSINWLTFVWAVTHDRVAASSLGYFLCPLVSVALALAFERERLSRRQWMAVAFGSGGVAWLFFVEPTTPLPALLIAFSWAGYGWCKRRVEIGPVASLAAETLILAPFAFLWIGWLAWRGTASFSFEVSTVGLFASAGLVTALPLILFAYAARRIPLSALGFLNYLVPTTSLLLAVFLYGEPFGTREALGFGLIWSGLIIYSLGLFRGREPAASPPAPR
ncbi:MAG: EamA family transporter RarD [Opitutales bacterium]|nr:EamA family transporter RarD [Opitutales bacterium]